MLNSGKHFRALRHNKKYSNSCVVEKFFLKETKNHNPSCKLNGRSLTNTPQIQFNISEIFVDMTLNTNAYNQ